jgi:hypothetical protein
MVHGFGWQKDGFRSSCFRVKEQRQPCRRITRHANSRSSLEREPLSKRPGTVGCPSANIRGGTWLDSSLECGAAIAHASFIIPLSGLSDWSTPAQWKAVEVWPAANFPHKLGAALTAKKCSQAQSKNFCNGATVPLTSPLLYKSGFSPLGFIPFWTTNHL